MNLKMAGLSVGLMLALGAHALETIKLPAVEKTGGKPLMAALQARRSNRAIADKEVSLETLAGLLWAANGYNRPDMRTNATGMNKQEITIWVCRADGAYRYDAKEHALVPVYEGDLRPAVAGRQSFVKTAPLALVITADVSDPVYGGGGSTMSHYDAGIVSGNIYLYCASQGLATVCRGTMDQAAIKKALKLGDKTLLHLNHPVGWPQE